MTSDKFTTTFPRNNTREQAVLLQRIWQFMQGFYYLLYKNLAGYFIVIICLFAVFQINGVVPLWPINLYTGMLLLALIFPLTAFLYFSFNLRTRFDEIQDAARRSELYYVYFTELDREQALRQFYGMLLRRFSEYYNPLELTAFSLMAGTLAVTLQFLLANQAGVLHNSVVPSEIETWVLLLMAGFFGALAGAFLLIVKKYRTFDIYPSTYLHAAVALVVGTVAGGTLSAMIPATKAALLIFAVGFFTAMHVSFFGEFLRGWLAKQAGVKIPPAISTDLNRVIQNSDAIESLNALSLNSISELVVSEPMVLYLNMPQPLGVINGWIDRALLHFYLESCIDALHKVNIERFTQLVDLLTVEFQEDKIVWEKEAIITGDAELDMQIQRTVRNIVQSRLHHRLLGILWEKYRKTFFILEAQ